MSTKPIRVLLAMCLSALVAAPAGATKYAAEFLKIPVGARAVGMGGAFAAVANDATAPFWNPAGMVYLPYKETFLQHAEQFGSLVNHNFGSAVFPMKASDERRSALGVALTWVGVDDIPITPRPGGLRPNIDFLDNGADNALGVSYARQRGRHLAWGGTVKFVRQSLPDTIAGEHVTSFGAGVDAG